MDEVKCPTCGKAIMTTGEAESLIKRTSSKTLLSHCLCGESFEIRSLKKNALNISTSSGKKVEQFIEDEQGS